MQSDRQRWNRKYRERDTAGDSVAAIVAAYADLAPPGRALDIAAGTGQNAVYLAERGFDVTAVDISDVALAGLAGRHPRLHPLCLDLDDWQPPTAHYRLIINMRYLNRRLFDAMGAALAPGGVLIFETFIEAPPTRAGASHRSDYLLRENELLHAFLSLEIVYYEECVRRYSQGEGKTASLVGIRR